MRWKWYIGSAIFGLLAVAEVAGMIAFSAIMSQQRRMAVQGQRVNRLEEVCLNAFDWWRAYWYVVGPPLVLLTILAAGTCLVSEYRRRRRIDDVTGNDQVMLPKR